MLVTFADANLMVGMAKVYQAKHCCFSKAVKQVGDTWNREHIELCLAMLQRQNHHKPSLEVHMQKQH